MELGRCRDLSKREGMDIREIRAREGEAERGREEVEREGRKVGEREPEVEGGWKRGGDKWKYSISRKTVVFQDNQY